MIRKRWLVVVGVCGVVLVAAAALYVQKVGGLIAQNTTCGFDVKDAKTSPDGKLKAAILRINCGATTRYSSVVVLTEVETKLDFERDRVAQFRHMADEIHWDGDKLVVTYNGLAEPTKQLSRYRNRDIVYNPAR